MGPRQSATLRPADTRREPCHRETKRLQGDRQQCVVLETVAAPSAIDKFGHHGRQVQPDRAARKNVKVLERNVFRVRPVNALQHLRRRRPWAAPADAQGVPLQVEGIVVFQGHPVFSVCGNQVTSRASRGLSRLIVAISLSSRNSRRMDR